MRYHPGMSTDKRARLAALLAEPRSVGPTTWSQGTHVMHQWMVPTSAASNMRSTLRLLHPVDPDDWRRRLQAILDRHPVLRSTYDLAAYGICQRVQPSQPVSFDIVDARPWTAEALSRRLSVDAHRPMDVYRGPLFRARLYQRTHEAILQLEVHHAACDLWSLELILAELHETVPASLPPPYLAYVARHLAWLKGPGGQATADWWRGLLAGASRLRIGPSEEADPAAWVGLQLDASTARRVCRTHGCTLFVLLLSVFQGVLRRLTGRTDILIASPVANRAEPFTQTVGLFANAIVYRQELAGLTPEALLARNRELVSTAIEHQGRSVETAEPFTDVLFLFQQYQKARWTGPTSPNDLGLRSGGFAQTADGLEEILYIEHDTINTPLVLDILEQQNTLSGVLRYRTTILTQAQAAALLEDFTQTLQSFTR
ncbi:MAG TPA: condensation domain-containing protein [Candidatus Xenobia bacterium]|jgi:hypothetical protein